MIYLVSISCALSFLNLIFILFLSNSIYRLFTRGMPKQSSLKIEDKGLVDIKDSPTYDPRFRNDS
jgi:hypothetical protein